VQEIVQQAGNSQGRYVKGGINTTGADYSKVKLKFNPDGTGSFTDPLAHTYTLTWAFAAGDEARMTVTVNYPTPVLLNYTFVSIDENNFIYTTYFTDSGQNAMSTDHFIPL